MRYFASAVIVLWQLFSLFLQDTWSVFANLCVWGAVNKRSFEEKLIQSLNTIHAMLFVSVQFWSCDILNQWEKNDYKVSINEISSLVLRLLHQSEMNKNFSSGNWNCDTYCICFLFLVSCKQLCTTNWNFANMRVLQNSL